MQEKERENAKYLHFESRYAEKYRDTIQNKKQTQAALQADGH